MYVSKGETTVVALENCGHKFHRNCLLDWLERKQECPICKRNIADAEVETIKVFGQAYNVRQSIL